MRGVGETLKRTLVKRKKTCFIFSVSFSVSLSIHLSVEGSRSVQQSAGKSKRYWWLLMVLSSSENQAPCTVCTSNVLFSKQTNCITLCLQHRPLYALWCWSGLDKSWQLQEKHGEIFILNRGPRCLPFGDQDHHLCQCLTFGTILLKWDCCLEL